MMDVEQCLLFQANPDINPLTGRKIQVDGPTHRKLMKMCSDKAKPSVKPRKKPLVPKEPQVEKPKSVKPRKKPLVPKEPTTPKKPSVQISSKKPKVRLPSVKLVPIVEKQK